MGKKDSKSKKKEKKVKEIISVGEDLEDDSEIVSSSEKDLEEKWWLEEPFRTLMDPELAKSIDLGRYDLSELIEAFTERMLKEDLIDFRISGLAIYSSAKLYHQKITGVIDEEEEIQKEEAKKRLRREIPKPISQPIQEARKIATSDELFDAMRRAIIETMQNREKLRKRRVKREMKIQTKIKKKSKGKLPAELLKHITGRRETIEERLQQRQRQIKEIISLENPKEDLLSINYLKNLIYSQINDDFGKKVKYIEAFQELLFLASLNKVILVQDDLDDPIKIKLTDNSGIKF